MSGLPKIEFAEVAHEYVCSFTPLTRFAKVDYKEFPCMTECQIEAHNAFNETACIKPSEQAASPCMDCSFDYRDKMENEGLCRRPGLTIDINSQGKTIIAIGEPIVLEFDFG